MVCAPSDLCIERSRLKCSSPKATPKDIWEVVGVSGPLGRQRYTRDHETGDAEYNHHLCRESFSYLSFGGAFRVIGARSVARCSAVVCCALLIDLLEHVVIFCLIKIRKSQRTVGAHRNVLIDSIRFFETIL